MSQQGLMAVSSELGIESGAIMCYYNFAQSNYDASDRILSVDPAISGSSGQIIGDINSFTGQATAYRNSGDFEGAFVEINNSSLYFSGKTSYVFSLEKKDSRPVTIFRNMESVDTAQSTIGSGYEFGLLASNNLFFRTCDNNEPTIYCSNFSRVAAHNLWAVTIGESTLQLGVFNTAASGFAYQSFPINSRFIESLPDRPCTLGTGEYGGEFFLDCFMAVSGSLGPNSLNLLARSSYEEYYSYPPRTSGFAPPVVTGSITTGASGTGITYSYVPSGETGAVVTLVSTTGSGITGYIDSAGFESGKTMIYQAAAGPLSTFIANSFASLGLPGQSPHEIWEVTIADGSEVGPQITGWSGSGISMDIGVSGLVYEYSGQTGFTFPTYVPSGETGFSGFLFLTPGASGISGEMDSKFNFGDLTFMGTSGTGNDMGDYVILPNGYTCNQYAPIGRASLSVGGSNIFTTQERYGGPTGFSGMFQFNGVTQYRGEPEVTLNAVRIPETTITGGDYYISGIIIAITQMVGLEYEGWYDKETAQNRARELLTTSGWTTASLVSPDNSQVYANGQKVYSGVGQDYVAVGAPGVFTAQGGLTDITGALFGYDRYTGSREYTGLGLLSVYDKDFSMDAFIFYLNGIRAGAGDCLQYSRQTCLLTGAEVWKNTSGDVYNRVIQDG